MKNSFDEKVKGHGFFRKTKAFGLASGIALGAALLIGANTVSADEVAPAQPATTASATNQSGDAKAETVVVDDGLTAKVKQMETEGFIIKQDVTKSVGTAKNAEEAKTLEAKAKAEEQTQIKEFDKMLQEKRVAVPDEEKKVAEIVEKTVKSSDRYQVVEGEINRVQRDDYNNGKSTFAAEDVKSDKGKPQFVKLKGPASDIEGVYEPFKDKNKFTVSETPSLNIYKKSVKHRERGGIDGYSSDFNGKKTDEIPFISIKVKEGETISFTYNLAKDSELTKIYGVSKIEKKFTLKEAASSDKTAILNIHPQMGITYDYFNVEYGGKLLPNDMKYSAEVVLKDEKGNVVDLTGLAAEAFNQVFFGGHKAVSADQIKSNLIDKQDANALKLPDKFLVDKDDKVGNSFYNSGVEYLKNGKFLSEVGHEYLKQFQDFYKDSESKDFNSKGRFEDGVLYDRQPSKFTWFADKYKDLKYSLRSYDVQKTITTTYVPNDKLNPGETKVTDDGKQSGKKVVEVGTKPSEKVEEIPFKEETRPNPALPEGERKVVQEGVKGRKVTRTTYTLDAKTGKVTPKEEVTENTAPKNRIVEVGTKKSTTEKPDSVTDGDIVTVYRPNDKLEAGKQNEVDPGKKSKLVNGKETEPGKPRIIEVGTKPVVVEKEIPFKEETRENKDLPKGERKVVQEGKAGKKVTTTTYKVDPKTGKVTSEDKVEETAAVDKIIEVGTKEEVKATPAKPQTPAAPKAQLPHTGTEASLALSIAGLAIAGIATTMVLKKKEQ